jgi:glycosyltransferase EpsF
MVRVLYVVDSLKQRFGVTAVVKNYLMNMQNDYVNIDLIVCQDSEQNLVDLFRKNGHQVYYMPSLSLKNISKYVDFWDAFFQEHKYDIVHSHFNQIDYIVFKLAKKYGVKECISHSHNTRLSVVWWKAIRNYFMCYPARRVATKWAACSNLAGEAFYGKKFINNPKSFLIHNAVDTEKFHYDSKKRDCIRRKLGLQEKFIIGNIGSFKRQKNKMFLLDILDNLIKKDSNLCLLNIGDGEERLAFEQKMRDMKLDKFVVMTGTVNNPNEYLQAMDVFVLPSLYEGLPVVGIEAQTAGLPCVFSDNITKEVDLLENNEFLSLKASLDKWSDAILKYKNIIRVDRSNDIKGLGYDIKNEAEALERYYRKIMKN